MILYYISKDFSAALQRLKNRWFHSILSAIGITIGVISIVVMLSVSEGGEREALRAIKDLGLKSIRISDRSQSINGINESKLDKKDLESIYSTIKERAEISPIYFFSNKEIFVKNKNITIDLYFSNQFFLKTENIKIEKGRQILEEDIVQKRNVALLSLDLARKLNVNIGQNMVIDQTNFTLVGIASNNSFINNFALLPISCMNYAEKKGFDRIDIYVKNEKDILSSSSLIQENILKNHNNIKNFDISVPLNMLEKERQTQKLFSTITLAIAVMSLLSGGVSVMNVMLSNISEQTREIGLRKALGATSKRIIWYYLMYAALITCLGGFFGIFGGYAIVAALILIWNVSCVFSIKALFAGLFVSIFAGILFGVYPSIRASKISPMQALREY